ncbi:hypothetical protein H6F86_08510 [Phormidium sp. FACHB-592]|uniref:Uncharacterized protein n=1 Tax=Stenomitos frigidus AS-A4 TaxID=2933935 RepID=A0ABV0KRD9_9CYAN|nr:hypothetical protein [Phormidium sp. FACHB-592]MBD2073930.1 hypothetical protein [Phormidium sp. FACHB-592]
MQPNCNGAVSTALILFHKHDSLDGALYSFRWWEYSQSVLGFGTIALSFDGYHWLVLVSADLIEKALPF